MIERHRVCEACGQIDHGFKRVCCPFCLRYEPDRESTNWRLEKCGCGQASNKLLVGW